MLKFGDAVLRDNTDWLIYTPDRYVNIRYNTQMPPWRVTVSGPSSAKAGSTVTVTVTEDLQLPSPELWNGKVYLSYYDKHRNYKTITVTGRTFTVPSDVDSLYNSIDVVAGYNTNVDYDTIIRFDLAEAGKYIYISACYPYVQSGTHYWLDSHPPYHDWESYNYNETAIAAMNTNPPTQTSGEPANLNEIQSFTTDDPSRMYTILNIGDKASTISTDSFSFKYACWSSSNITDITMTSYRRVNSLITGPTDVQVYTKTFTSSYISGWSERISITI